MKKSKIKKLVRKLIKKELKEFFQTNYGGVVGLEKLAETPKESAQTSGDLFLK